eukprot:TRINITY_DN10392_c0_g1_i1.p1 TRINITY_DN10392_c0_g1~~TRINITY_DN10392_c0_g1_i1.p1  ORF type:complete len:549 (+),score=127.96 TRINITY_DN10392_c0_g1_i1:62-1708(+)
MNTPDVAFVGVQKAPIAPSSTPQLVAAPRTSPAGGVAAPKKQDAADHSAFCSPPAAASVVAALAAINGFQRGGGHHRSGIWRARAANNKTRRQLFGGSAPTEAAPSTAVAPASWQDLEAMLMEQTPKEEAETVEASKSGRGPLRVDAAEMRLFDAPDASAIRVKLYRDHAAWCPYCEKVQLALEEKRVPYSIEKVNMNCYGDKSMSFLVKNPMGLLPAAEIDGVFITESNEILATLERDFADYKALVPPGQEGEVQQLLRLERQLFSSWFGWVKAPGDMGKQYFLQDLQIVENVLAGTDGPYFLGSDVSMVECHFASFLERMAASVAYFKGYQMRRNPEFPNVEAWFTAMEGRDSYRGLAGDFYTHAHDLPPQVGGCLENDDNAAMKAAIDGVGTWRLPLPDERTPLEPFSQATATDAEAARREAARKLIGNHANVTPFCLRALGSKGFPGVMAGPLSDPRASPSGDQGLSDAVDEALRSVVAHLLSGGGEAVKATEVGPVAWTKRGEVPRCLAYLRDRVSVPRDMSFPAARQFRAHLNSYIGAAEAA